SLPPVALASVHHRARILRAMSSACALATEHCVAPSRLSSTTRGAVASVPQYIVVFCLDTTASLGHNPRQHPFVPGELGSRDRPRRKGATAAEGKRHAVFAGLHRAMH